MAEKVYYDLHLHSCLSPCGDDDMTPNNIAGMASIKGLNVVALTDHNTCGNCPSFFSACENFQVVPIAGAEVTTMEDIHVVTLFETLEGAMEFNEFLSTKRVLYENDSTIFGKQLYIDSDDSIIGEEKYLLINAVDVSIDDINSIVKKYSGISYPAHIDRSSNSLVSVFGMIPDYDFTTYEFFDITKAQDYKEKYSAINNKILVTSSDAHYLWDINEKLNYFLIDSDISCPNDVRKEIFSILRGDIN